MSNYFCHPTAVIDEGASIGANSKIWHFCHVSTGARIGRECVLGQNVYVAPTVVIGDGVHIQNNVSLYDGVVVEDFAFLGPSAVFTNVVYPRSEVSRRSEYRKTIVGRGATIGANATIVCGHELGPYSFIGAGAVVTANVAPHALVVGVPGRAVDVVCTCGERLGEKAEEPACPACGRRFARMGEGLVEIPIKAP
jgi:UDP-2-acetamido-3-amino-2,3-dideoxy-glucuronate N-acetyltransferase